MDTASDTGFLIVAVIALPDGGYRRTKNLRAVQLLIGQTTNESTVRYLGIEVADALEIAGG